MAGNPHIAVAVNKIHQWKHSDLLDYLFIPLYVVAAFPVICVWQQQGTHKSPFSSTKQSSGPKLTRLPEPGMTQPLQLSKFVHVVMKIPPMYYLVIYYMQQFPPGALDIACKIK